MDYLVLGIAILIALLFMMLIYYYEISTTDLVCIKNMHSFCGFKVKCAYQQGRFLWNIETALIRLSA